MKQGVMTAVIVGVVVVVLALGYLVGTGAFGGAAAAQGISGDAQARIVDLEESVDFLAARVAELIELNSNQGTGGPVASGGSGLKVAYVDMFKVLETLGTELADEEVLQALEEFQAEEQRINGELQTLQQQFADGQLSLAELEQKQLELQLELQTKNFQLSAPIQKAILDIVVSIGRSLGYGLIIDNPASKFEPIILFSQPGSADDITQDVIDRLKDR